MTTEKIIALTIQTFVGKMMSLLFNELSRFVIAFLPRNECLLISWLHRHLQWFWNPRKWNQTLFPLFSSSICHKVMGLDAMIFVFWMLSFKPAFSLSSFIFINRLLGSSLLSAIRVLSPAYLRLLLFLHVLTIVNSAAVNIGMQVSSWIRVLFFQTYAQKQDCRITWQLYVQFF